MSSNGDAGFARYGQPRPTSISAVDSTAACDQLAGGCLRRRGAVLAIVARRHLAAAALSRALARALITRSVQARDHGCIPSTVRRSQLAPHCRVQPSDLVARLGIACAGELSEATRSFSRLARTIAKSERGVLSAEKRDGHVRRAAGKCCSSATRTCVSSCDS